MRYAALATDYDGTIATHGAVDDATLATLRRARAAGIRLLLVTGRTGPGIAEVFDHLDLFDRVVIENGAVLQNPATGAGRLLCDPAPPALVDRLSKQGVPLYVGQSIVASHDPHGPAMVAAIRALGLPWHVIPNKDAQMALPIGVDKASGLAAAVADLGLSLSETVAVGDAENDIAMLRAAGMGAAVANALPEVRAVAGWVATAERGAGVAELVDHLLFPASGCLRGTSDTGLQGHI